MKLGRTVYVIQNVVEALVLPNLLDDLCYRVYDKNQYF